MHMANESFSDKQIEQLRTVVREEVRTEVRKEVAMQLAPIHEKLDEIRVEAVEDSDALAATVVFHNKRLSRVEKHLSLKPLPIK